jgi:formylglycine-generating enzyme required for sulfatase activity
MGRLVALWIVAGASACIRDNWTYSPRPQVVGSPSDAAGDGADAPDVVTADIPADHSADVLVDATTDAPDDRPPSVDALPMDAGGNDAGSTDLGPADVGTRDSGAGDVGSADAGSVDANPPDTGTGCPAGMALIPAGQFLMGDASGTEPLAMPVHGVRLRAFCLDVTEVTVAAYEACPSASCTAPGTLPACNWGVTDRRNHPINCVTVEQARAYCQWRSGAGLPTEAQWEYAARRADGQPYPWGDAAPGSQLCWSGGGSIQSSTCPVRSFPAGASLHGLFDMVGSIAELTSDWFSTYTGNSTTVVDNPVGPASGSIRVIRGGNWRSTAANDVRVWYREGIDTNVPFSTGVGFRCMRE